MCYLSRSDCWPLFAMELIDLGCLLFVMFIGSCLCVVCCCVLVVVCCLLLVGCCW